MKPLLICVALVLAHLSARATIIIFYSDGTNIFAGSDGKLSSAANLSSFEIGQKIFSHTNVIFGVAGILNDTNSRFEARRVCGFELGNTNIDAAIPRIETICSNALYSLDTNLLQQLLNAKNDTMHLGFGFLRSGQPEFHYSKLTVSTNTQGVTVHVESDRKTRWTNHWRAFPGIDTSISDAANADPAFWSSNGGFGAIEALIRAQIKVDTNVCYYPIYRMRLGPDGITNAPLITSP